MAKKSTSKKVADPTQEEFRKLLKGKSLKVTAARLSVLRVLSESPRPLTHAEVQDALFDHSIDQSTIFRNLNDLTEVGLVRRTELGDHMWRFELIRAEHSEDHPHFVCLDCGSVTCLPESALDLDKKKNVTGIGTISQVLVKGHCVDCEENHTD